MAIPTFDQFIAPLLRYLSQHEAGVSASEASEGVATLAGVTEGELRPVFERCAANPAWRPTRKEFNELRGAYTARSVKAWDDLVHGALQVYRRLFLSIPLLSDAPPAQTAQQATLSAEIDVVLKHDSDKLKRHAPDLLRKLADFEPQRKVSQDDLRAYKLCNAWWSSLFDAPTRSPGGDPFAFPVEHPYVLLP